MLAAAEPHPSALDTPCCGPRALLSAPGTVFGLLHLCLALEPCPFMLSNSAEYSWPAWKPWSVRRCYEVPCSVLGVCCISCWLRRQGMAAAS